MFRWIRNILKRKPKTLAMYIVIDNEKVESIMEEQVFGMYNICIEDFPNKQDDIDALKMKKIDWNTIPLHCKERLATHGIMYVDWNQIKGYLK